MDPLRTILVGVDFSPGSAAALRQAVRLSQASGGAKVIAAHVINTHVVVDIEHALSPLQKNIQASLETEAKREWMKFEPDLPGKERIDFRIRVGNLTAALLEEAAGADLVALGIHREAGSDEGAGAIAGAFVRKSPTRALLVRPGHTSRFQRVMACMDFSDASRLAAIEGARMARLDGAQLDIVHVFEPAWREVGYFAPMGTPEAQTAQRASVEGKLREFCAAFGAELGGIKHEFKLVEHQSAGRGVLEYASKNGVDLIVMGARGRTNLRDALLGSTAERVLRQTTSSMMTVRDA